MQRIITIILLSLFTVFSHAAITDVTGGAAPTGVKVFKIEASSSTASERIVSPTLNIEISGSLADVKVTVQIVSASPDVQVNGPMPDLTVTPELSITEVGYITGDSNQYWSQGQFFRNEAHSLDFVTEFSDYGIYVIDGLILGEQLRFIINFKLVDTEQTPYNRTNVAHERREYYMIIRVVQTL